MLSIYRYKIKLKTRDHIKLPAFPGSAIRGLFGKSLKRTACVTGQAECHDCQLKKSCVYTYLFEPTHYHNNRQPPIVFHISTIKSDYPPEELVEIEFSLIGQAVKQLPFVVQAWHRAGKYGFHNAQSQQSSHFMFEKLQILNSTDQWVELEQFTEESLKEENKTNETAGTQIKNIQIKFLTPYRSKYHGHLITPDKFTISGFILSLINRINNLNKHYDQGNDIIDANQFKQKIAALSIKQNNLHWQDVTRKSSRQHTLMKLGGIKGDCTINGPSLNEIYPILCTGEKIHAGKSTVFGLGAYTMLVDKEHRDE
jgi:hypothetical protein